MTTPYESWSFKATGASADRTWAEHISDIVNVKDFGAKGNGSADDGAAIQAALDAGFGSLASPHAQAGRFSNRPVYFPAGDYHTAQQLGVKSAYGKIFGDGSGQTRLLYTGSYGTSGPESTTTLFTTYFIAYSSIEGLTFDAGDPNGASGVSVAFFMYKDGNNSAGNANCFRDVVFQNAVDGCLIGYNVNSLGSENLFRSCVWKSNFWGMKILSFNALDQVIIGGAFENNSVGIYAPAGSVICMIGPTFKNNSDKDFALTTGDICALLGATSNSQNFGELGGPAFLSGVHHVNGSSGTFAAAGEGMVVEACHSSKGIFAGAGSIYLKGNDFDNAAYLGSFSGSVGQNV